MTDLFRILCVQYHIVSVEYFLDKMELYEIEEIMEALPYYDSPAWERCRLLLHSQVSMNSKHKITPQELMSFPWDRQEKIELPTTISDKEISELRERAKLFEFK